MKRPNLGKTTVIKRDDNFMETWQMIVIPMFAFLCEYMDSTLGMGYGTTLTPVFILMGFSPIQIVPVILFSELVTGLLAGFFHHREGNVNFSPKTIDLSSVLDRIKTIGYVEIFKRSMPRDLKIALLLGLCSAFGTVFAVFVAINIPKLWLKMYIGFLVLAMGVCILVCLNKQFRFSWKKITLLGLLASFNKGISGGGYGPIVTGGQILAGIEGKSAVGIASLAEGITCLVGVVTYILVSKGSLDWKLAPWVVCGAVFSVPLSAKSVKVISTNKLKLAIAVLTIFLGTVTIVKSLI